MRRLFILLSTGLILLMALSLSAGAQEGVEELEPRPPIPAAETRPVQNESPELWFVELASPPAVEGTNPSVLRDEKRAFRNNARRANLQYDERFAFDTLWNGLSVAIRPSALGTLSRISGVKALYPVETVSIPDVLSEEAPALETALAMTGATVAQNELGLSGQGVRVAVMDTGIDYNHPALGGCFGSGCRVETGFDFVGDDYNAGNPDQRTPTPDDDPMDCHGHGTHVAGIVGASGDLAAGGARGVAPGVTFGAYRVFGCSGSTTADIMIAAMERTLQDDMDVLNMSIGASFQWPQYPTAVASDRLVNQGVVVVASFGNSGRDGVYSASAPGVGQKVIGTASYDNSHVDLTVFRISPDDQAIGYGPATAALAPPSSGSLPMARTGNSTTPDDACEPVERDLTGQVVLIRRGSCLFHTKALNAQNAGAAGVVLYNNVPGRFSPTVAGEPAIEIPVVAISDAEGELIDERLAEGEVTMTWTADTGLFQNPTGGLISTFSSFGLSPDLTLKPDIGAPGGMIRSTYPVAKGSYATVSGTSMAAPHIAGTAALLLEARPNTPAQAVRGILQNSAQPRPWWGNPGLGFFDNVHRQGAGIADIVAAVQATTRIEPAKLSVGDADSDGATHTLTLENSGDEAVTFDVAHQPALSTGRSTFSPSYFTGFASVEFSRERVTVPAGGEATVGVTIHANPGLPDRGQYGGYIRFTSTDGEQVYSVPYAGFKGDYQSIEVLDPQDRSFPRLARPAGGGGYTALPDGGTFSMVDDDIPYLLVHLGHQVRKLRMEVFDVESGRAWHRALDQAYMRRSSSATSFFALPWDGVTTLGNRTVEVPNGRYVIRLSVQKALGEDNNPDHWESWISPVITIERP